MIGNLNKRPRKKTVVVLFIDIYIYNKALFYQFYIFKNCLPLNSKSLIRVFTCFFDGRTVFCSWNPFYKKSSTCIIHIKSIHVLTNKTLMNIIKREKFYDVLKIIFLCMFHTLAKQVSNIAWNNKNSI